MGKPKTYCCLAILTIIARRIGRPKPSLTRHHSARAAKWDLVQKLLQLDGRAAVSSFGFAVAKYLRD